MSTLPAHRKPPIPVSHPDKLYWPREGYTKLELIQFYDRIFPKLAPWVRDRLLVLERCPDGLRGKCFYQKEKPDSLPSTTRTRKIVHANGTTNYVVGGARRTQLALANLGAIAVHVWNSRARTPRQPDWVCFDLDPSDDGFAAAAAAALHLKGVLDTLDLVSFVKTSGGKGLHVFVPIRVGPDADDVLDFAQEVGARLADAFPDEMTIESRKASRHGRVYLDAQRNAFGQTVVAPYSVRWRPAAPVSTPLDWSEVEPDLDPASFNLGSFEERRLGRPDPWADFFRRRQALGPARQALRRL
jgi:bifunctional non-homologous end joining protein LigD